MTNRDPWVAFFDQVARPSRLVLGKKFFHIWFIYTREGCVLVLHLLFFCKVSFMKHPSVGSLFRVKVFLIYKQQHSNISWRHYKTLLVMTNTRLLCMTSKLFWSLSLMSCIHGCFCPDCINNLSTQLRSNFPAMDVIFFLSELCVTFFDAWQPLSISFVFATTEVSLI